MEANLHFVTVQTKKWGNTNTAYEDIGLKSKTKLAEEL